MATLTLIETFWQDVRYAFRTLASNRGVTIVSVLALSLGIGANTTVYTVISSALGFDSGVDEIERLVILAATDASGRTQIVHSYPQFSDFRSQIKSIDKLAAYRFTPVNVSDRTSLPERYSCVQMTISGFSVMKHGPILGRAFTSEDERAGAPPVLMLAYHVWRDRYGSDRSVIGRVVRVNEVARTVVGVMPSGIRFPEDTDMWIPLVPSLEPDTRSLAVFGRLADHVNLSQARAEMNTISHRLESEYPVRFKGVKLVVRPFLEIIGIYAVRPLLLAVFGAVAFVLLIACADVANLLLARAAGRSREISIRIAIGAGRMRIIRQLLMESMLLSGFSGLFGWMVALVGLHWFDAASSHGPRPAWVSFSMDAKVFAYLAAISIGTGILFGLAPALRLAKVDVNNSLKDGGQGTAGATRGRLLASSLVVTELVLCIVLLAGAGLLIRSSVKVYSAPIGVNAPNVLTMHVNLPEAKYPRGEDRVTFHRQLKAKLESLPGVGAVSVASFLPTSRSLNLAFELEGTAPSNPANLESAGALVVGADYFRVLQVPPLRGHWFTEQDELSGSTSVIVNQSFAAKFWGGEDPLGKHLRRVTGQARQPWLTVVGVVPDIQQNSQRLLEKDALIYFPYATDPQPIMFVISRTALPPASLVSSMRRSVQSLDEDLPVYDVAALEDRIAQSRLNVGAFSAIFAIFAGIALLLAAIGLYAVIAHSVSQRTREIGVRIAVGGTARDIAALIISQGLRQIVMGLVVGLPLAFGLTRVLRAVLVGISPGDPITLASVVFVLLLVGVLGCALPARRAIRIDPVVALRCE